MKELENINKEIEKNSIDVFPFISKYRITILQKGFYRKKVANYRGVSLVHDTRLGINKALLIGYFYVPIDCILVPEEVIITEGKQKLIDQQVSKGFKLLKNLNLDPYEFSEDSHEFKIAKEANDAYKNQKL
jgi:hypothetical protein